MSSLYSLPFVVGASLAAALWQGVSKPVVHCVCSGIEVNQNVLILLGRQLDRCGPDQLEAPCPEGLVQRARVCLAIVAGIVVGALGPRLVLSGVSWCRRSEARPELRNTPASRRLAIN